MDTIIRRNLGVRFTAGISILVLIPGLLAAAPDIALRMTVNPQVPTAGQPVEFTITASNFGSTAAGGVQVTDTLPPELTIPAGLAAFPSIGSYDAATGVWSIGSLAAGASATLVIPAVVAVTTQPACSVNVAESNHALDTETSNNRAVAAVKRSVTDRCVDLVVVSSNWSVSGCEYGYRLEYHVSVANAGPDDASDVYLDMAQVPAVVPHLKFGADACSGSRCTIDTLPAGTSRKFTAESDPIDINNNKNVTFTFSISSGDTDYATLNNQRQDDTIIPRTPPCEYGEDPNGGGAAGGGCFIATAAYGSALEPHVMALREFRDRYLQRSTLGRAIVRFYYRHSPPAAAIIARHEALRFGVRMLLTPLVMMIEFPGWAGTLLAMVGALLITRHRRRCRDAHAVMQVATE
jgi:uncharacterized repeat protein (TIGR01451 family)